MPRSYTPKVDAVCQHCGQRWLSRPCELQPYCSHACYVESRRGLVRIPKVTRPCRFCGTAMVNWASQLGTYCSKQCANEAKKTDARGRFSGRVGAGRGCQLWTGRIGSDGYGVFWLNGRSVHAHRAAWLLWKGPIANGLSVCHQCDNPLCVRLDHLFLGSPADNSADMVSKGRAAKGSHHRDSYPRGDQHFSRLHPELVARGERHGMAVLNEAAVFAIRERHRRGETPKELGAAFGVQPRTIYDIITRRSWSHLP